MDSAAFDQTPRVLVVDDEKMIREILADFLSLEGFWVRTAEDGAAALAELARHPYDLVISDLKMPKMDGIELLENINRASPNVLTVIMTGFGTVQTAIDAMKRGAYDYVLKPFKIEEVIHIIQRGLEKQRLAAENIRLREALSLYKVSEAIAASLSLEEVLATMSDAAVQDVGADLVVVLLADGEGGYFERLRAQNPEFKCDLAEDENLASLATQAVVDHFRDEVVLTVHGPRVLPYLETHAGAATPSSLIVVPLRVRQRTIGYLATLSFTRGKRFDEGQRKLLAMVSSRAAAAIENARLYEDLKATFHQTIQGLARAIDKMDRYTAGHSDRVAFYATMLAQRLGLPPDTIEIVRQSALMHDIGKIGCVMNLNKPGKLSQEEYEIFKKHPGFGREILEPIKFLHPLVPGVHLHHERWDGRGYPLGLRGKDIPLIARIISVADTYDAMTSDRSYRKALPHEVAAGEIERCSGSQFDPECAHTFLPAVEEDREDRTARGETIPE
jgi:response regulator RpfG family c-di-GMP phosphodiesterase